MRTISCAALTILGIAFLAVPPALAANDVGPTDILLANLDGRSLQFIPQNEVVKIRITLNNTNATQFNGSLTLRLQIEHEDGSLVFNQTLTRMVSIPAQGQTVVEQNWAPSGRKLGNHTLTVMVDDSTQPGYAATFTVTKTAVAAGSYPEKLARYSWIIGAFALVVILFAVVMAARRA